MLIHWLNKCFKFVEKIKVIQTRNSDLRLFSVNGRPWISRNKFLSQLDLQSWEITWQLGYSSNCFFFKLFFPFSAELNILPSSVKNFNSQKWALWIFNAILIILNVDKCLIMYQTKGNRGQELLICYEYFIFCPKSNEFYQS